AFFFSSRRRHTRFSRDWSSDVCSSDLRRKPVGQDEAKMADGSVRPIQFETLESVPPIEGPSNLNLLLDVPLALSVELGSTKMRIREILELGIGSVMELDRLAGGLVDILVNGKLVAKGE